MSLLEDLFLNDEANEAQELERVIEDDEYDERPRALLSGDESDGGRKEDEAEEDKRRVDPNSTKTKRVTKNPRFLLNPARLTGPRGIQVIPEHFKDFKFKGKGHEKEDLDIVLKRLEHWAYRLYPKFQFKDCLKKIETLGKKRPVMVHLHKIRTDQFLSEETVVQKDSSDDEAQPPQEEDEFDKLLQQQIEIARATPAPGSVKKGGDKDDQWARVMETPNREDRTLLPMPKATSSPSISDEQKERMLRNRRLAEERRLARVKQAPTMDNSINTPKTIIEIDETESVKDKSTENNYVSHVIEINDEVLSKRNSRKIIDSSDSEEEYGLVAVNESIVVDIHNDRNIDDGKTNGKMVDDESKDIDHKDNDIEEMTVDDDHIDEFDNIQDKNSATGNVDKINYVDDIEQNCDDNNIGATDDNIDNNDDGDKIAIGKENHEEFSNETEDDGENIINEEASEEVINKNADVEDIVDDKDNHEDLSDNNVGSKVLSENSNHVQNKSKEITNETTQGSPKPAENNKEQTKDTIADEFTEEMMDVDFTDDF